jgi:cytochrome b subunit of formate dehydrogenase
MNKVKIAGRIIFWFAVLFVAGVIVVGEIMFLRNESWRQTVDALGSPHQVLRDQILAIAAGIVAAGAVVRIVLIFKQLFVRNRDV